MRLRVLAASFLPLTVLTALLLPASPAAAHDALASATPAAGAAVSGDLGQVTLTFSEAPLAGLETGILISVIGPDGAEASAGSVRVDGSTLTKPVDLSTAGGYTLAWRSVSVDGHPISGSYQFTSTGTPTGATATASAIPTPTVAATPTATPGAAVVTAEPTTPAAIWTLSGLTAALSLAVVAVLVLTRGRAKAPE